MKRFSLLVTMIVVAVAENASAQVPDRPTGDRVVEWEVHAEAQAWQYSGVDLPKGSVATINASGQWKINPLWKEKVGPGGKWAKQGGKVYVKPGANEGCLLIRVGDSILFFSKDAETIIIETPGKIYFCANDEPTEDGVVRFKDLKAGKNANDYVGAIPIGAPNGANIGAGFLDNIGSLKVRVAVKKSGR